MPQDRECVYPFTPHICIDKKHHYDPSCIWIDAGQTNEPLPFRPGTPKLNVKVADVDTGTFSDTGPIHVVCTPEMFPLFHNWIGQGLRVLVLHTDTHDFEVKSSKKSVDIDDNPQIVRGEN